MKGRPFVKELGFQFITALGSLVLFAFGLALVVGTESIVQQFMFNLAFAAPVYLTLGVLFSAVIEWSKRRYSIAGGGAGYMLSLAMYAAAGGLAMYVYLATILRHLQIHTSRDVWGLLLVGAAAAVLMYHVVMLIQHFRRK